MSLELLQRRVLRLERGTSGTAAGTSLARKPLTPHISDDEFEGDLSDWTFGPGKVETAIVPYGNFVTATEWRYSLNVMRPSWLMVQPSADGALNNIMQKPVTVATDFLYWSRISWNYRYAGAASGNDMCAAIYMASTTPGDFVQFYAMETDAGEYAVQSTGNGGGAELILIPTSTPLLLWSYYGIQKIGNVMHFWVADESCRITYLPTLSFTYAGTPMTLAGLSVSNAVTTAPGNAIVGFDFVRFRDDALWMP